MPVVRGLLKAVRPEEVNQGAQHHQPDDLEERGGEECEQDDRGGESQPDVMANQTFRLWLYQRAPLRMES